MLTTHGCAMKQKFEQSMVGGGAGVDDDDRDDIVIDGTGGGDDADLICCRLGSKVAQRLAIGNGTYPLFSGWRLGNGGVREHTDQSRNHSHARKVAEFAVGESHIRQVLAGSEGYAWP